MEMMLQMKNRGSPDVPSVSEPELEDVLKLVPLEEDLSTLENICKTSSTRRLALVSPLFSLDILQIKKEYIKLSLLNATLLKEFDTACGTLKPFCFFAYYQS